MKRFSGKFVVRIAPELHAALSNQAKSHGCSLNQWVTTKLMDGVEIDNDFIARLKKTFDPLAVIQFGSTVRGEENKDSDIDLLIVLSNEIAIERSLYTKWDKTFPHPIQYSPQFVHAPDLQKRPSGIWLESALEGQILFLKDVQIRRLMSQLKDDIARGRYQRKWSHGQPYWVSVGPSDQEAKDAK